MEIARKIGLLVFALALVTYVNAQDYRKVDSAVFPNVEFVQPNPPKEIKGWTFVELGGQDLPTVRLTGEYPAKILKFEFEGDAVGIAVLSNSESGTIEYSVDDMPWLTQDLYVDGTESLRYFTLEQDLKAAKHMLQIRLAEQKNPASKGYKCVLTHFFFNSKN